MPVLSILAVCEAMRLDEITERVRVDGDSQSVTKTESDECRT